MNIKIVRPAWLASSFLSLCLLSANAQPLPAAGLQVTQPAPPTHPVVLVELFTSEGCSSCPPADALLREINGKETAAGQTIIGISEHVTYWNGLGWSDPYSSDVYTTRQNAYGQRFHLDSVYTPQMIINGSEQIVGSDRSSLMKALQREQQKPQASLRLLSVDLHEKDLKISFSANGYGSAHEQKIMAVLVDDSDQSSVARGENAGRLLAHVSVARWIGLVATVHGDLEKTVNLSLPPDFRLTPGTGQHVILFAQEAGMGAVIGADTRPL